MTIELKTEVMLELPDVPTAISGVSHPCPNGVKNHEFDVADLTELQLCEIADEWKTALLNTAKQRREARNDRKE